MRPLAALLLLGALSATAANAPAPRAPPVRIDDRGKPAERRALESVLTRLARSPTARRLDRRLERLAPVTIRFAPLAARGAGAAPVLGEDYFGRSHVDGPSPAVELHEGLLVSSHALVETAAHELYGHSLILREARRAGLDIGYLLENEAYSLAVGYLVARESGESVNEEEALDALAESTGAYHGAALLETSTGRFAPSRSEAGAPRAAVAARQAELARRRDALRRRERELALWGWQLAHLEREHGLDPQTTRELHAAVDDWTGRVLPERRAKLDAAAAHLREVARWLAGSEGRAWEAEMIAVSGRPYALALEHELAALGRRLAGLKAKAPAPADASAPGPASAARAAARQLDWDEISRLARIDRAKHPEHWKDAPAAE